MKTIELQVYKFSELSYDAREYVIENRRRAMEGEDFWEYEIRESLNAVKGAFPSLENTDDFSIARNMAYIENNMLSKLRIKGKRLGYQYGKYYRFGMIKDCPFTGVCYDNDFLEFIMDSIIEGYSMREIYQNLDDEAGRLSNLEYEYATSEENIIEYIEANDEMFFEDGRLYY